MTNAKIWLYRRIALVAGVLLVGCNQTTPPVTNVTPAPVSAVESKTDESTIVPVRHEVVPDGPRIRIRTTLVRLEKQVPKKQAQAFATELPDLFGTDEACRVVATDEISTVIDGLESQAIAGRLFPQAIDVTDGQTATWKIEWPDFEEGTVTPTLQDDGTIQITFVPPRCTSDSEGDAPVTVVETLRENETLVIAKRAELRGTSQVTRTPIVGEIPWIGPRLFTSRSIRIHCVKVMYLVSCEAVP